jgi:hypothetical protein
MRLGSWVSRLKLACKSRSGPAIFRVHYEGHDYQPHINHVGQTERARTLHNLGPKADTMPDFQAFRFDHQMAGLICLQHTTLGAQHTRSGTPTTARPQALIHRLRPSAETTEHLSRGTFGEYLAQQVVQSATLEVEPVRDL